MQHFKRFLTDESGATAIEYGLLAALISVMILPALTLIGPKLLGTFNSVEAALP
jgi:pilus assembly protein Flp/PilA